MSGGGDMLDLVSDLLEPYLGVVLTADPLAPEDSMVVPDNVNLLDLQDTENSIGQWFDAILQEADALLGTEIEDPEDPSGWNLGVNVFLRNYLLDQDRALTLDVDTLFPDGVMLFEGHDKLTETTIELNAVKLFGLDTFSKFEPLLDIGRYTLQNESAWDYLTIELDVTITIKPSTLDDSVIEEPSATEVIETVKIEFGVENLDTVVSLLLAVDQDKLKEMQLGPLLDTGNLLPCLLSCLFHVQLAELSVGVGSVREPTLDDFVSAGIDRVVSDSVKAVFAMYETVLRNAVPNMFHLDVMDIINKEFFQKYMQDPENLRCEVDIQGGGYIDFRDLFLEPGVALFSRWVGRSTLRQSRLYPHAAVARSIRDTRRKWLAENQLHADWASHRVAVGRGGDGSFPRSIVWHREKGDRYYLVILDTAVPVQSL